MELIATFLSLAPRATDDVLRRLDDQMLVVDLLENDLVYGATVTSYTQGSEGGQVSITPEGILTYQPPDVEAREIRGQTQPSLPTDTFTYTLENSVGSSVARVSVKTPPTIYVDAGAASGGNGSESQPFNDLKVALEAQTSQPCHIVLASGYYNVGELTLSRAVDPGRDPDSGGPRQTGHLGQLEPSHHPGTDPGGHGGLQSGESHHRRLCGRRPGPAQHRGLGNLHGGPAHPEGFDSAR